jgi:Zn-dependent protease with chaperone function
MSSSSAPPSAQLEAALATLKRGQHETAIAQLDELLSRSNLPEMLQIQAQMGLVKAYASKGEPVVALGRCKQLEAHLNPQVQAWAAQTQKSLYKRYPELQQQGEALDILNAIAAGQASAGAASGSVLEPRPSGTPGTPDAPKGAESGFQPLGKPAPPQTSSTSGFRAIPDSPQAVARRAPTSQPDGSAPVEAPGAIPVGPRASFVPTPRSEPTDEPASYSPQWRNADRLRQPKTLGKAIDLSQLILPQLATAAVVYWVAAKLVQTLAYTWITGLSMIPLLGFPRPIVDPPWLAVGVILGLLAIAAPWILGLILHRWYGARPLPLGSLGEFSLESAQQLRPWCQRRRVALPQLELLPQSDPVIFSYWTLPKNARVVVSQGLLDQLSADELASLVAREVGLLSLWTLPLATWLAVLMQLPHLLYQIIGAWAKGKTAPITQISASILAGLSYSLFALVRWLALPWMRSRTLLGDRLAVELTGNPNGLSRALVKVGIAAHTAVLDEGRTGYLSESFDCFVPLGHHSATTLGSLWPVTPLEPILQWDLHSPYRHWLNLNAPQPPVGDRLRLLSLYAQHSQLTPEFDLAQRPQKTALSWRQWRVLIAQGAPFVGAAAGWIAAQGLSLAAALTPQDPWLGWMRNDPTLLTGLPLIGFSVGTFLRINRFFPDIKFPTVWANAPTPALPEMLTSPQALPLDSTSVRWQGILVGREGLANDLSQDLLLQTPQGLVRLHWSSRFGPVGNWLMRRGQAYSLVGQEVTVTGWFRRGATPWIDLETIQTAQGRTLHSEHPLWSTILAIAIALLGILLILRA